MNKNINLPNIKIENLKSYRLGKLQQKPDSFWIDLYVYWMLDCCKNINIVDVKMALFIEKQENPKNKQLEKVSKQQIRKYFKGNARFNAHGHKLSRETDSESKVKGKSGEYDLVFSHSGWIDKYFPFECKCLDETNAKINEYIFTQGKEDGGVYRYVISKYGDGDFSEQLNYCGMIGFILSGNETTIIDYICIALEKFELPPDQAGKLIEPIKRNAIANNTNTFESTHIRRNAANEITTPISLLHIMMDFS